MFLGVCIVKHLALLSLLPVVRIWPCPFQRRVVQVLLSEDVCCSLISTDTGHLGEQAPLLCQQWGEFQNCYMESNRLFNLLSLSLVNVRWATHQAAEHCRAGDTPCNTCCLYPVRAAFEIWVFCLLFSVDKQKRFFWNWSPFFGALTFCLICVNPN